MNTEIAIKRDLDRSDRQTILLSLHVDYWEKIISGEKKYEYRFVFPREKTRAYIYVPGKVKAIKGYIDLEKPIQGDAETIARIYERSGDGLYQTMIDYISTRRYMYAMRIEAVSVLNHPITYKDLKERFPDFFAPQSYIILDKRMKLKEYIINSIK